MASTTSDKVGGVATVVIMIVVAILVLWPWHRKKTPAAPGTTYNPDLLGPSPKANAPAPPAEDGATNAAGVNAQGGVVLNGTAPAPKVAAPVPEPEPQPDARPAVRRSLDAGDGEIIII